MDILQACLDGMYLTSKTPDIESGPVDFVLTTTDAFLVAHGNWWLFDWLSDGTVLRFDAELGERSGGWYAEGLNNKGVYLSPPEESEDREAVQEARERIDFDRDAYLLQLVDLQSAWGDGEFDFGPWIELLTARPARDAVAELKKKNTESRKILYIFLDDVYTTHVDILVLDEHGNTATVGGTPWLEEIAGQWRSKDERPAIEDFAVWVQDLAPYGGAFFTGKVAVVEREGRVDAIASNLFTGK